MRIFSYILLLLVIILGICFAMLNSQSVVINYFIGRHEMALSLLLVLVFALGCIVGVLITSWLLVKAKMRNRHLQKRLKLAEKEVENLRAIPLQNKH